MSTIAPKFKRVWKSKYFSSRKLAPPSKEGVTPSGEVKSVTTDDTQETKVQDDATSTAGDKKSLVEQEDDADLGVIPKFTKLSSEEDTKEPEKKEDPKSEEEKEERDDVSVDGPMPWVPFPYTSPYLVEGQDTTPDLPISEFKEGPTWHLNSRILLVPNASQTYNPPYAPPQISEPTGRQRESAERKSDLDNLEERLEEALKELEGPTVKPSVNDGTIGSFPIKEWENSTVNVSNFPELKPLRFSSLTFRDTGSCSLVSSYETVRLLNSQSPIHTRTWHQG
jgi:hypothetical protein